MSAETPPMTLISELRERHHLSEPMTLEKASRNIELARHHGTTGYLAGWEHKATRCADETIAALLSEIDRLTGERDAAERKRVEAVTKVVDARSFTDGEVTHGLSLYKHCIAEGYDEETAFHCALENLWGKNNTPDDMIDRAEKRARAAEQRLADMQRMHEAAEAYYRNYLVDEAEDQDLTGIDDQQHARAVALRDALATLAQAPTPPERNDGCA